MRLAVSDIGSNSVRLLIADCTEGNIKHVKRGRAVTRLGETDEGRLTEEAMRKTADALYQFKKMTKEYNADLVKIAATCAVREAENSGDLLDMIRERCGLETEIISGIQEAVYTYRGALSQLPLAEDKSSLVIDVGGGSTEFIRPSADGELIAESLPLGAVRMTRYPVSDNKIIDLLGPLLTQLREAMPEEIIGCGGTITTLAAAAQGLFDYDREKIQGYRLQRSDVERMSDILKQSSVEEIKTIPGISPSRADIITAGAQIVKVIMQQLDYSEIIASEADILHGMLLEAGEGQI